MPTPDRPPSDCEPQLSAVSYGWSGRNFLTPTKVCTKTATLLDREPARGTKSSEQAEPADATKAEAQQPES